MQFQFLRELTGWYGSSIHYNMIHCNMTEDFLTGDVPEVDCSIPIMKQKVMQIMRREKYSFHVVIIQIDDENLFYCGQMLVKPGTILKNHSYHSTGYNSFSLKHKLKMRDKKKSNSLISFWLLFSSAYSSYSGRVSSASPLSSVIGSPSSASSSVHQHSIDRSMPIYSWWYSSIVDPGDIATLVISIP